MLRQSLLPTAAGHWYLLSMAVLLLIVRTEDIFRLALPEQTSTWLDELSDPVWKCISYGVPIAVAFLGAICIRQSIWWRLVLISMALQWILTVVHAWDPNLVQSLVPRGIRLDTIGLSVHSIPAAVSLAAMIHDRRSERRHDFYHWLGIFALWATTVLSWPSHFWYAAIYG
jgi:hypothetical protein